jgi:hypothetical protein
VTPERLPCNLPPLPFAPHIGGVPHGNSVIVTQDSLAELGRFIAGMYAWIEAASPCVETSK